MLEYLPVGTKIFHDDRHYETLKTFSGQEFLHTDAYGYSYLAYDSFGDRLVEMREYFRAGFSQRSGTKVTSTEQQQSDVHFESGKSNFINSAKSRSDQLDCFETNGTAYFTLAIDMENSGHSAHMLKILQTARAKKPQSAPQKRKSNNKLLWVCAFFLVIAALVYVGRFFIDRDPEVNQDASIGETSQSDITASVLAEKEAAAMQLAEDEAVEKQLAEEAAEKLAQDEAAAKQLAEEEAVVKQLAEDEAVAKQLAQDEAAAMQLAEEVAEKLAQDEAVAKQLAEDEAVAKQLAEDEAAAMQLAEEVAEKLAQDEAIAKQLAEEEAVVKQLAEEAPQKIDIDALKAANQIFLDNSFSKPDAQIAIPTEEAPNETTNCQADLSKFTIGELMAQNPEVFGGLSKIRSSKLASELSNGKELRTAIASAWGGQNINSEVQENAVATMCEAFPNLCNLNKDQEICQ